MCTPEILLCTNPEGSGIICTTETSKVPPEGQDCNADPELTIDSLNMCVPLYVECTKNEAGETSCVPIGTEKPEPPI